MYGHSMHRVYDDWLDLMLHSLQRDDENYLETLEDYGEEEAQIFAEAFGELQNAMGETNTDILGIVYEELGQASDHFGQHFTPHNVCEMKAEMVIGADQDTEREEPYTIADPASGTGRLLIYAAKQIPGDVDAVFYGQDKDSTCAKMTALNMVFFNMDGYAVQGDSLTLDKRRAWETRGSPMGGEIRELEEEDFPEIDYEAVKEEVEQEAEEIEQEELGGHEVELVDLKDTEETTLSDFAGGGGE